LSVEGGCDNSVGSGADLFEDFILFVDDEGSATDFVEDSAFGDDGFLLLGFHV
jgi:hypothetical protein